MPQSPIPEHLHKRIEKAARLLPKKDRANFTQSVENKVGCDPKFVELENVISLVLSARGVIRGPR